MPHPHHETKTSSQGESVATCPECGGARIRTETVQHRFPLGDGPSQVELTAKIPLSRCQDCEAEFFDSTAEMLMHDEVCRHLGVMTPAEIHRLRERCGGLTRAEFARVTKLGEATLGRWERGELIQNPANDQLLYLLTFPENLVRLRARLAEHSNSESISPGSASRSRFRVLSVTADAEARAKCFRLATTGAA